MVCTTFLHKPLCSQKFNKIIFRRNLKFFRVAHSKLGAKASVLVQVLTARGRGGKISFFSCSQKWTRKTPKPLRLRGFPVRYLFWSHNVVAGGGLEPPTPVMSCGLDGLSAPLRAFAPFLSGTKIRFEPLCSVGPVQSEPRMVTVWVRH